MESFVKAVVLLCACLASGAFLCLWLAGAAARDTVALCLVGALMLSPFIFILSTWIKMPFLGVKQSLTALLAVLTVALLMIAGLDATAGVESLDGLAAVVGLPPYFFVISAAVALLAFAAS